MAIDFNALFNQLKIAIVNLAKEKVKQFAAEAASDGTSLLHIMESDIEKYAEQLAENKITTDQFQILLTGDEDLIEMTALTEAGLAEAAMDEFKKEVFDTIITTVLSVI